MKKNINKFCLGMLFVFLFGCLLSASGFAAGKNTQQEIKKAQKYVNLLDKKIKKLSKKPTAKNKAVIVKLKQQKQYALQRIKSLKAGQAKKTEPVYGELIIDELETEPPSELASQASSYPRSQVFVGMAGGAGTLNLGYNFPVGPANNIRVEAGFGLGNQYSIIDAGISGTIPLGAQYVGLRLGVTNYSTATTDVPGLSGIIPQGAKVGGGVFGGLKVLNFNTEIGYSTDYGFLIGLIQRF
ncbi:MAG: hypothetical protein QME05_02330 [Candidatus Margulisbacteria bacterium]|nr:hypothetical protein [Candidatus Margulisiibacteriota bacterium]